MSEKTFTEMVEKNMRDITRMKQEAYQKGFTEGERRAIEDFLDDYKSMKASTFTDPNIYIMLNDRIKKWERRRKE